MSEVTRVAVVGTGWWGRQHTRVFSSLEEFELCAVVGRTPDKTAARAAEFGVPAFTDLDAMLGKARPDLVALCLPNTEHFAPTLRVIEAGVPLFVEKPLAFEFSECDALLDAAAGRDLFFAINFNHRFAKPVRMAKDAVEAGRLGEADFARWRFGGEGRSDHYPHANLIETQCHGFDMLEWLLGPIEAVSAESGRVGTVAATLRFQSGAVGSLVGSYSASYAHAGTHALELSGTGGRVLVDDTVRRFTYQATGSETAEVWEASYFNDRDRAFERTFDRHAAAMLNALTAGEEPPVHARAGRRALVLAEVCIRSAERGRRVATVDMSLRRRKATT